MDAKGGHFDVQIKRVDGLNVGIMMCKSKVGCKRGQEDVQMKRWLQKGAI